MKTTLYSIFCLGWLLLSFHLTQAQSSQLLHAQLELNEQPGALRRTANVRPAPEGGYLQVGTWGSGEYARAEVVKLNADLEPEWSYRLSTTLEGLNNQQVSYGADICALADGSYFLLAAVNQSLFNADNWQNLDYALIHFTPQEANENASVHSIRTFGGSFADIPQMMERTNDGGLLISGISNAEQALNLPSIARTYLIKLDEQGELEWDRRLSLSTGACQTGGLALLKGSLRRTFAITPDNAIVLTAHCNDQVFITKLNMQGDWLWSKRYDAGNGLFDGAYSEDWNAVLGAGAGSGGSLVKVLVLPNGNLAFLGNQLSFFFVLFGNELGLEGNGSALPMSYCLVTDPDGNFLYGNAFFRQTYGQPNFPIEMLAEDMIALSDSRVLISGGIRTFNNGATSYQATLLKLDLQSTAFNEAIVEMHAIDHEVRHTIQDYPWGLDPSRLNRGLNQGILWSFGHDLIELDDPTTSSSLDNCLETIPQSQLYSFPFELELFDAPLTTSSLASTVPPSAALAPFPATQIEQCRQTIVEEDSPLSPPHSAGVVLAPSVSRQGFQLIVQDEQWLGAQVWLYSVEGRLVYQNTLDSKKTFLSSPTFHPGLYYIMLRQGTKQITLKGILLRN